MEDGESLRVRMIVISQEVEEYKLDRMLMILHTASDDSDKIDEQN